MSDPLTHSPADVLRWLLIDLGFGTDPDDDGSWPIFAVNEPDDPENLIVIRDTAGTVEGFHMTEGDAIDHHGFQLVTRSNSWGTGFQKSDALKRALDNSINLNEITTPSKVTSQSYTVYSVRRVSTPTILPTPESKRYRFIINGLIRLEQQ